MNFIVRIIFLALVMIPSVIGDCLDYRVRNPLIVLGLMLGLVYQTYISQLHGLWLWLSGSLLPILILGILFLFKVLGAGDIKLFSVIGGLFGPSFVLRTIVVAFFIGGLLSVIQLIRYRNLVNRLQYLAKFISLSKKEKGLRPYYDAKRDGRNCVIHFTIAIAVAVLFCMQYDQLGQIFS